SEPVLVAASSRYSPFYLPGTDLGIEQTRLFLAEFVSWVTNLSYFWTFVVLLRQAVRFSGYQGQPIDWLWPVRQIPWIGRYIAAVLGWIGHYIAALFAWQGLAWARRAWLAFLW